VSGAGLTRFQAAFIPPAEIAAVVDRMLTGQRGWDMVDEEDEPNRPIPVERAFPPKLPARVGQWLHRAQAG
jgi:hypothetical protein